MIFLLSMCCFYLLFAICSLIFSCYILNKLTQNSKKGGDYHRLSSPLQKTPLSFLYRKLPSAASRCPGNRRPWFGSIWHFQLPPLFSQIQFRIGFLLNLFALNLSHTLVLRLLPTSPSAPDGVNFQVSLRSDTEMRPTAQGSTLVEITSACSIL